MGDDRKPPPTHRPARQAPPRPPAPEPPPLPSPPLAPHRSTITSHPGYETDAPESGVDAAIRRLIDERYDDLVKSIPTVVRVEVAKAFQAMSATMSGAGDAEEVKSAREAADYWMRMAKQNVEIRKVTAETAKVENEVAVVLPAGLKNERWKVYAALAVPIGGILAALLALAARSHM